MCGRLGRRVMRDGGSEMLLLEEGVLRMVAVAMGMYSATKRSGRDFVL